MATLRISEIIAQGTAHETPFTEGKKLGRQSAYLIEMGEKGVCLSPPSEMLPGTSRRSACRWRLQWCHPFSGESHHSGP